MRFETIIIGVDFTPESRAAAAWVAASFPRAHLVLAHACPPPTPARVIGRRFASAAELANAAVSGARERLEEFAGELQATDVALEVQTGHPQDVLVDAARRHDGDLIVIGPHVPRAGLGRLLGSTGEGLLRMSALPVLLIGQGMSGPPRRILAPVDGSPVTADVLRAAKDFASIFGASVQALYVFDTATYAALSVLHACDRERVEHEAEREASLWYEHYRHAAGLEPGEAKLVVTFGEARHEILAMAQQRHDDMIVMASHGAGNSLVRRMVGSVAAWVLRYTRRSVLVLRSSEPAQLEARALEETAAR